MQYEYFVVNSFAQKPFEGNPAAVFLHADGMTKTLMQKIAKQMNLVESVFVAKDLSGAADFALRYFTPTDELPVAGHPTIAAIRALVASGEIELSQGRMVTVATGAGDQVITIDQTAGEPLIVMQQPQAVYHPVIRERGKIAAVLGLAEADLVPELPIQPVDTGLGHIIVPVRSLQALMKIERRIQPLKAVCEQYGMREVQAFTFETLSEAADLHTRNICPREGVEDPGCGVGNGALGAYLLQHKYKPGASFHFRAEQGVIAGMPCLISVYAIPSADGARIAVGGAGQIMMKGIFYAG